MPQPIRMDLVIGAYDMARELPRTIETWAPAFQQQSDGRIEYRITLVDNGSPEPVDAGTLGRLAPNLAVRRIAGASPSPAAAINAAVGDGDAPYIGLVIDGARMASPGLLRWAAEAFRLAPDGLVGTYGFHLGPDIQHRAMAEGYDRAEEDRLLAGIPWRRNGYRLFDISVFAGSSKGGWFRPIAESNALFLPRTLWNELGGLDVRFASPGGGYVNIDFWQRAIIANREAPWMIIGEGTFHQIHGGAATNAEDQSVRQAMRAEFEAIRGEPFGLLKYDVRLIGRAPPVGRKPAPIS
ncbi:MAG: hypothetical protein ABR601_08470 [Parasphingopyxis sp.]|nr:hypothetical protein [Sphingomonadales bacterium]